MIDCEQVLATLAEMRQATVPFRAIHDELSNFSADHVQSMLGEDFEEFVGRLFEAIGFRVRVVGGTSDGGVDVKIYFADKLYGIVQCKRYTDKNVSASQVRDLVGAFMATDAQKAYIFTTSSFTSDAKKTANQFIGIELYDFAGLNNFVESARNRIERRGKIGKDTRHMRSIDGSVMVSA